MQSIYSLLKLVLAFVSGADTWISKLFLQLLIAGGGDFLCIKGTAVLEKSFSKQLFLGVYLFKKKHLVHLFPCYYLKEGSPFAPKVF